MAAAICCAALTSSAVVAARCEAAALTGPKAMPAASIETTIARMMLTPSLLPAPCSLLPAPALRPTPYALSEIHPDPETQRNVATALTRSKSRIGSNERPLCEVELRAATNEQTCAGRLRVLANLW